MVAVRHLEGHKLVCGYRMDKCSRCQTEMQHTKLAVGDEWCTIHFVRLFISSSRKCYVLGTSSYEY